MGERDGSFPPHIALDADVAHSAAHLGLAVELDWLATPEIARDPHAVLSRCSGLWAAPGSIASIGGALAGIQFARESGTAFFGTCGGFQHAVLEFARNVLKLADAAHEAYDPDSSRLLVTALAASLPYGGPAQAHEWPARPLTMVVPFAAGGGADLLGRILATPLSELLGQPVTIENVGGGGGTTGALRVSRAAPDGYQFVLGTTGTHAQNQSLYKNPLYHAATDFTPVALLAEQPIHDPATAHVLPSGAAVLQDQTGSAPGLLQGVRQDRQVAELPVLIKPLRNPPCGAALGPRSSITRSARDCVR